MEETLYKESPSMFRNHPVGYVLTLVLCLVGVGIPILIVWYVRSRSTVLTVTNMRTSLHRGWLSRAVSEVWHGDVRNVQMHQTAAQRVLGTGRISISSAGQGGIEIDVNGMPNPYRVKDVIDKYRVAKKSALLSGSTATKEQASDGATEK